MEVITRPHGFADMHKTRTDNSSEKEFTRLERIDTPAFHIAPAEGWLNDPNGPLLFNGTYHMFFQHLPGSAVWGFNLVWGHAASKDLVHWELLPHAIEPTPGSCDGDGCFSGCAVIDTDGTPALLYTGVRLRGSLFGGPLPPEEYDLGLPFIESQCVAYAENPKGDWRLPYWRKSGVPFLTLPPPNVRLSGWRDPYIIGPPNGHPEQGWLMLIGSGVKDEGGTVLVYRSKTLTSGWQLAGELCSGRETDGTGLVWECPLLVEIPMTADSKTAPTAHPSTRKTINALRIQEENDGEDEQNDQESQQQQNGCWKERVKRRHFFCISPDACTNPSLYYLGEYYEGCAADHPGSTTRPDGPGLHVAAGEAGFNPGISQAKFLVKDALGPFRLDLGDVLYAPNTLIDADHGRVLLWAWMQEARKAAGTYTYAGCLSCPREMWLEVSEADPEHPRLLQRPCHELAELRKRHGGWTWPAKQSHTDRTAMHTTSPAHQDANQQRKQKNQSSEIAGATPKYAQQQDDCNSTSGTSCGNGKLLIRPGKAYPIPCVQSPHLDIELQLSIVWPDQSNISSKQSIAQYSNTSRDAHDAAPSGASDTTHLGSTQGGTVGTGTGADVSEAVGVGRVGPQDQGDTVPPPEGACSGLVIRVWQAGVEGAAALLYCWATNVLEVVFEALDPETHEFSLAAPGCRRVGGVLASPPLPGQPLDLRILLDHSLLEVFTGGGEVLSTRVYRGTAPPGEGAGIDLVSLGCTTRVVQAAAYEMQSCWVTSGPLPVSQPAAEATAATMAAPGMPLPINNIESPFASLIRSMSGVVTPSQALSRATSVQEALPLDILLSRRNSRGMRSTRQSIAGTPRDSVAGTPFASMIGTPHFTINLPPPGPPPVLGMSPPSRRATADVLGLAAEQISVGSQSQQQSHFTSALDAALAGLKIHQDDVQQQQQTAFHHDSTSEFGSMPNTTFLMSPKVTRLLPANDTSLFPSMDNMRLSEMMSSTGGSGRDSNPGRSTRPATTVVSLAATSSLPGSIADAVLSEPIAGSTATRPALALPVASPTVRVCGFNTPASPSAGPAARDRKSGPGISAFSPTEQSSATSNSNKARGFSCDVNGHVFVPGDHRGAASDASCDSASAVASRSSACSSAEQQSSDELLPGLSVKQDGCNVQQEACKGKKQPSALTAGLMTR